MNFYQKHILPRFLNFVMKKSSREKERQAVAAQASGIVLEVGFGSGLNIPFYRNVTKFYALEPSQWLYNFAKDRIALASFPVEYIEASAEKIPLNDNSIDTVVSTWTLCSIPHPELAIKEIRRVLKPDGKFVFIEHGRSSRQSIAKWQRRLTPISKCFAGGCHLDREIDRMITESGLTIINLEKVEQYPAVLGFTYKGTAMREN